MPVSRVWVWEKDVDHADILTYNLRKAGFKVRTLKSDEFSFNQSVTSPDVILLGSGINDLEKASTCRQLSALSEYDNTRVVCLTTDDECWERDHYQDLKIDACIILPAKPKKIVKLLKEMLQDENTCQDDARCICPPASEKTVIAPGEFQVLD